MYRIVRDSNGKVSLKPCPMVGCESLFRYEPYKERDTSQMPSSLSRWIRTTNLGHEIKKTLESNRYWILVLDKSNWLVSEFKKLLDNPSAHYVDIDDKDNKIAIAYLKAKMPDAPVGVKEDLMKPAHQIAADALLFGCTPESVVEAAVKTPGGRIPEIPCAVCGHNPDQHEMSNSMPGQVEVGRCTVTGCSCRGFVKPQRVGEVTEARVPTDVEPLRKTKNFSVFPAKDGVRIVTRRGTRKSSVLSTKDWEYLQSLGDDSFDAAMVMDFGVGVNEASPADAILAGQDPERAVEARGFDLSGVSLTGSQQTPRQLPSKAQVLSQKFAAKMAVTEKPIGMGNTMNVARLLSQSLDQKKTMRNVLYNLAMSPPYSNGHSQAQDWEKSFSDTEIDQLIDMILQSTGKSYSRNPRGGSDEKAVEYYVPSEDSGVPGPKPGESSEQYAERIGAEILRVERLLLSLKHQLAAVMSSATESSLTDSILSGADPEKVIEATVDTKRASVATIVAKDETERDAIWKILNDSPGSGFSWTKGYDSAKKEFSVSGASYHDPDYFRKIILDTLKGTPYAVTESMVRVDEAGGLGRQPELDDVLRQVFDVLQYKPATGEYLLKPKPGLGSQLKQVGLKIVGIQ